MLAELIFLSLFASEADAARRPTTFTVDPRLSTGAIENFRELFVDPAALTGSLLPGSPPRAGGGPRRGGSSPNGDLTIENLHGAWALVTVSGVQVGVLGPLTDGVLHDVKGGVYEVTLTYPNGFTVSQEIETAEAGTREREQPAREAPGSAGGPGQPADG